MSNLADGGMSFVHCFIVSGRLRFLLCVLAPFNRTLSVALLCGATPGFVSVVRLGRMHWVSSRRSNSQADDHSRNDL